MKCLGFSRDVQIRHALRACDRDISQFAEINRITEIHCQDLSTEVAGQHWGGRGGVFVRHPERWGPFRNLQTDFLTQSESKFERAKGLFPRNRNCDQRR